MMVYSLFCHSERSEESGFYNTDPSSHAPQDGNYFRRKIL
jgi:hypothetical protein